MHYSAKASAVVHVTIQDWSYCAQSCQVAHECWSGTVMPSSYQSSRGHAEHCLQTWLLSFDTAVSSQQEQTRPINTLDCLFMINHLSAPRPCCVSLQFFTIKMQDGVVATSYANGDKFYIDPMKLLPLDRFLPKPKGSSAGITKGKIKSMVSCPQDELVCCLNIKAIC